MKPTFIGLGVQKCASTWLYRLLEEHPSIQTTNPKELDFFSRGYAKGFNWYESFFHGKESALIGGEISPSYFYDALAPARAANYNPDFKIIVALRDPIARVFSNHLHEVREGRAVPDDLSVEAGLENNFMYIEQCRYATHLKHWMEYFPRQNFSIFLQEEIERDPQSQAKRLFEFLDVDHFMPEVALDRRSNASVVPKNKIVESMLRKSANAAKLLGLGRAVQYVKVNPVVGKLRSANMVSLKNAVPAMMPETTKNIEMLLADEIVELAKLLNREKLPWPIWDNIEERKTL